MAAVSSTTSSMTLAQQNSVCVLEELAFPHGIQEIVLECLMDSSYDAIAHSNARGPFYSKLFTRYVDDPWCSYVKWKIPDNIFRYLYKLTGDPGDASIIRNKQFDSIQRLIRRVAAVVALVKLPRDQIELVAPLELGTIMEKSLHYFVEEESTKAVQRIVRSRGMIAIFHRLQFDISELRCNLSSSGICTFPDKLFEDKVREKLQLEGMVLPPPIPLPPPAPIAAAPPLPAPPPAAPITRWQRISRFLAGQKLLIATNTVVSLIAGSIIALCYGPLAALALVACLFSGCIGLLIARFQRA